VQSKPELKETANGNESYSNIIESTGQ